MDEATPHLHMNVVPVATGYKQGITKRPSFQNGLRITKLILSNLEKCKSRNWTS